MGTGTILDYEEFSPGATAPNTGRLFKEGSSSTHERGVLYQGPWQLPADGFHEHVRRSAEALADAGCPVHLRNVRAHIGDIDAAIERRCAPLARASIARYAVQISHVVPSVNLLQRLTLPSPSAARVLEAEEIRGLNQRKILYTVWERFPAHPQEVDAMNRVGQVWVACEQNAEMLAESGVVKDKLRVVPVPHFQDDPHLALAGRARKDGAPRFYHIGKWEPRKAQDQIVAAFLLAFRPGDAELYLKTSPSAPKLDHYPYGPVDALRTWMRDAAVLANGWRWPDTDDDVALGRALSDQGLHIFQAVLPDGQLVALHGLGDVYVTLSRGEGFDMPAYDAKLAGNRMVYTPSGGPQDFAASDDPCVPVTSTIACSSFYAWGKESRYHAYRLLDAVDAMQAAARLVRAAAPRAAHDLSALQADTVGADMLAHIETLVGARLQVTR